MEKTSIRYIFLFLFTVGLFSCNPHIAPSSYQTETTAVGNEYAEDQDLVELIDPYKQVLDAEMNRVIGYFAHDMKKSLPESELGNFMGDAPMLYVREKLPAIVPIDFCLMNYGGIRITHVPQGDITVETMFEIMPFENELVVMELTGETFKKVMERVARKGGWPISKEVNLLIENEKVRDFLIDGEPVDWDKTYRVMFPDYVANGGDGMEMLEDIPKEYLGIKLRDALIGYCEIMTERRMPISAKPNGRIIVMD